MIFLTDYIESFEIESSVLKNYLVTYKSKDIEFDRIEVLLIWHYDASKENLAKFSNLKAIVRYGVGFDNIDIEFCKQHDIKVFNNPDYGVDEVSDTALSMFLHFSRKVSGYNDRAMELVQNNDQLWQEEVFGNIRRNRNLKFGVIGCGRIGTAMLAKVRSLVGEVHFFDPWAAKGIEKALIAVRHNTLEDMIKTVDVISLHCPLNASTKGMIDDSFIRGCKKGLILINTARGGLLESGSVLVNALEAGSLGAVALDVLPVEPPTKGDPLVQKWLSGDERILINPHTAYFSQEAYFEMRENAAHLALDALFGKDRSLNRVC